VTLPLKHSVAVIIFRGNEILAIRRPEDDDELPGIWGLPAGTLRGTETIEDVIQRIGRDKLGVTLTPLQRVASGVQDRPAYRLEMELWEASMEGVPRNPEWRWASLELLRRGMESGSLCCKLAIQNKGRAS
jgi:8-oxo-dGTP diphosphatase